MITKQLPIPDLLRYLKGSIDAKKQKREQPPRVIRGSHEQAAAFFQALAPFSLATAQRRRWFYPKVCRHILHNFAETQAEVGHLILPIVRGTEDIFLAGLRRDALAFVTYFHEQEVHPHPHIVLLEYLHPFAGPYQERDLAEEAQLLQAYNGLCNVKFGLDDPLDPKNARLLHPARYSNFPECFQQIDQLARDLLARGQLTGSSFPKRLPSIGVKPIFSCALDGTVTPYHAPASPIPPYPGTLVVETPEGRPMVLSGLLARVDFTMADWKAERDRRRALMEAQYSQSMDHYRQFRSRIQKRAERQRAVFPRAGCAGPRVAEADFAWLEPEPPRKIIPPSLPSMDR
jgi:hypothetical protein